MIVVRNTSGAGNRIKNIVSALRRADLEHDGLELDLDHHGIYTIDFEPQNIKQNKEVFTTWGLHVLPPKDYMGQLLINSSPVIIVNNLHDNGNTGASIDLQYTNIKPEVRADILQYFNMIKFNPVLTDMVEQFNCEHKLENYVGVHIRSWVDDPDRYHALHDMQAFYDLMQKCDQPFFVCSDSQLVIDQLIDRYHDRILTVPIANQRHISYNNTLENHVAAYFDMLLLSKCSKIIGTYQSTFCEAAWWLSGTNTQIEIAMPKYVKSLYARLKTNI